MGLEPIRKDPQPPKGCLATISAYLLLYLPQSKIGNLTLLPHLKVKALDLLDAYPNSVRGKQGF